MEIKGTLEEEQAYFEARLPTLLENSPETLAWRVMLLEAFLWVTDQSDAFMEYQKERQHETRVQLADISKDLRSES